MIMKAIDIELQAFKDLDVYDTVSRKTIPRGAEIIYSHIVFDKKYKIDPETKRNVFLKWKARVVFDGRKQKSDEDTFSPTPSLPMIPTPVGRMLYIRVGSETQRPWKCLLCYTTGRESTICEAAEWFTRHNRGYHLGSSKRQFKD